MEKVVTKDFTKGDRIEYKLDDNKWVSAKVTKVFTSMIIIEYMFNGKKIELNVRESEYENKNKFKVIYLKKNKHDNNSLVCQDNDSKNEHDNNSSLCQDKVAVNKNDNDINNGTVAANNNGTGAANKNGTLAANKNDNDINNDINRKRKKQNEDIEANVYQPEQERLQ
eukprot:531050_1